MSKLGRIESNLHSISSCISPTEFGEPAIATTSKRDGHRATPEAVDQLGHSLLESQHCTGSSLLLMWCGKILLMMSFLAIDVPSLMEPSFASPTLFE